MTSLPYLFQHTVLFIDDFKKCEGLILSGLFAFPVSYAFCENRLDLALQSVKANRPDLLVVTTEFKTGTAIDFAEQAKQKYAHIPSLYLAEPHLESIQNRIIELGSGEVIQRPSQGLELITRIEQALTIRYRRTAS